MLSQMRASWSTEVIIACALVTLVWLRFAVRPDSKPGAPPMRPAMDLRRVIVPTEGVRVSEQSSERLELATESWILTLHAIDPKGAGKDLESERKMHSLPDSREDVLQGPGAMRVHRFLTGVQGPSRADQVHYVVSFGDGWAYGWGSRRDASAPFDVTPFDNILLALRTADGPRLDLEVPPAWRVYQKNRAAGSPIAKFVFGFPAPIVLGNREALAFDRPPFSHEDHRRGGRQLAPDLIQFYTKGDPLTVRLDLWLDCQPTGQREPIFETTLRVDSGVISTMDEGDVFDAHVPPGNYLVSISRVNPGKYSDHMLTDDEQFQRDDLERYEVCLNRRQPNR